MSAEDNEPKPRGNPRPITPNTRPELHEIRNPSQSLAELTQPLVDDARQLVVDLGLRSYTVHSVVIRWSGGVVHKGEPTVISDIPILPTPFLADWSGYARGEGLSEELLSGGLAERGNSQLTKISTQYTEADIRTLFHIQPLPPTDEGFIEIRTDARDGVTTRRRFAVRGTPYREDMKFQWRVRLQVQDEGRQLDGKPDARPKDFFPSAAVK